MIRVREATPAEADALAELGAVTFREAYAEHLDALDLDAYIGEVYVADRIAGELADPAYTYLVAEAEGELIGFVLLYDEVPAPAGVPGERPLRLHRIYTRRAWWGAGVGPALMAATIERARQRGFSSVWLTVWDQNDRAIAFYRRNGFEVVGMHPFHLGREVHMDPVLARAV
jgi:ribosomal protein S18 acetylase RimI-like enzyme